MIYLGKEQGYLPNPRRMIQAIKVKLVLFPLTQLVVSPVG